MTSPRGAGERPTLLCAVCGASLDPQLSAYVMPLCAECSDLARDPSGHEPWHNSQSETGANPVWVRGYRCFRRYHLGSHITIFDPDQRCSDYAEFLNRHSSLGQSITRFTLQPDRWYAMEIRFVADPAAMFPSPIKVRRVAAHHSGRRDMRVDFLHADYPAGVQTKEYELRVLDRGPNHLVGRQPDRLVLFVQLTLPWLRKNYPTYAWVADLNPERQAERLHPGI